ncbi:MAG: hypothetical protein ACP5XB_29630 [Isosphaeraceae bacterium]
MGNTRRLPGALALFWACTILALGTAPACAQWDPGFGWGWGWGGFRNVPSPTEFLNQEALNRASRAGGAPASNRSYAGNPNAYYNRIRDNGFVPRYDVQARRPPAERPQPPVSLGQQSGRPSATLTAASARPKPIIPLASFFAAGNTLAWPGESPVVGDLKAKRDFADQASLAVLEETKQHGAASISSVAEARQKLLDYGRPALQEVRSVATPRVADTFHLFLLSLYESLAQAASPPSPSPEPAPAR